MSSDLTNLILKWIQISGSRSIRQYNIDINTEEGLVRVYALVDPNILMKALARTGYHAEVKWVKLSHPKLNINYYENNYDSYNYQHGYNYGAIDDPYSYRRALPDPLSYPSHQYPVTRSVSPYYHGSDSYYYGPGLPPARYVPSYPPKEYDPYDDEPISFCTMM
ncbi:hypothetical protein DH2020_033231 [Rehmannia glutinosa]|uniref:HMA domain-containing protein n=1 Tax=Rehmannia glutinosa TaxID=99300 RepID=A0ABR0VFA9_REHGL